jgi:hypothetical protein
MGAEATGALKTVPDIIKAASATNLGILALLILVLAVIAFVYFRERPAIYQLAVFVVMFLGVTAFGYAAISVQHKEAMQAREDARKAETACVEAQSIRDLTLKLNFIGTERAANPWTAKVVPMVQKSHEPERVLTDVVLLKGVGGIAVRFLRLDVGDRVYLVVEDDGLKWRSDDMRMLEAQLNMNRMNRQ